ncbi:MAG: NADH-quinone oxidoreductase subunit M [Solirubrobacteraceae bacterium]|nr:NADH-quinone oxidoreductase subunit M [Solirubrobacteraceae bacterium]
MNAVLIALLAVPAATGLLGVLASPLLGRKFAVGLAGLGTLAAFVLAVILAFEVDPSSREAAVSISQKWIPSLGMRFELAVDGLNAALLVLTTFVWLIGTWWSMRDKDLATPEYFLLLALGQSAVLGAFLAQDLILFVLFFDLMLLPFVLITARAAADGPEGMRPVVLLLVYTLVGSLLMLVASVALGILAQDATGAGSVTFNIATLANSPIDPTDQKWILLALMAAFLIKMPIVPLHGWFAPAYRAMPFPALVIFAAVLSKVAAYGFLKIALPILPDAVVSWRLILVILALVSIIYASLVAFTTNEPRLVLGYSSIAQLGFILLGISSLDPAGAQGAIFQSITHALVVVPAVILVAVITERANGVERLDQLGGLAKRAPVLTALFLVVALAWLAMPGTGNFVAEYLVLLGQWRVAPWAAIIAAIGVVLAAFYALRLMIGALQNARGDAIDEDAPELGRFDGVALGVSIGALVLLSLVPQLVLRTSETAGRTAVSPARALYESEHRAGGTDESAAEAGQSGTDGGFAVDPALAPAGTELPNGTAVEEVEGVAPPGEPGSEVPAQTKVTR